MRYPAKVTKERHSQLVERASEMIREHGVDGMSVGDAMKAAGLTHGAFYSHFASKTELVRAAIAHGMEGTRRGIEERGHEPEARRAYIDRYLSMRHRDGMAAGCTMASLSGELRDKPELQDVFTEKLKEILAEMGGNREADLADLATMVGAISLARATNDEALAVELLQAARKRLLVETA
jgi:TetR/AcrR family transcriptional repressor of nem operon